MKLIYKFLSKAKHVPKPSKSYPECECNLDGRQTNANGDWCWLVKSKCILENGAIKEKGIWADCEKNGKKLIDCGGKNLLFIR